MKLNKPRKPIAISIQTVCLTSEYPRPSTKQILTLIYTILYTYICIYIEWIRKWRGPLIIDLDGTRAPCRRKRQKEETRTRGFRGTWQTASSRKHLSNHPWKIINAAYVTRRGRDIFRYSCLGSLEDTRRLSKLHTLSRLRRPRHIADAVEYLWYLGHYLCVEGSVIGTSSASLILAHTGGAWLSTIGALCKYRLQPHQLRVQLAEPPGGSWVRKRKRGEQKRARKGASVRNPCPLEWQTVKHSDWLLHSLESLYTVSTFLFTFFFRQIWKTSRLNRPSPAALDRRLEPAKWEKWSTLDERQEVVITSEEERKRKKNIGLPGD